MLKYHEIKIDLEDILKQINLDDVIGVEIWIIH